jgi:hypothetical protein
MKNPAILPAVSTTTLKSAVLRSNSTVTKATSYPPCFSVRTPARRL